MAIFDTYSKRKKRRQNAGQSDVYSYDELPPKLIGQIFHIWRTAIGIYRKRGEMDFISDGVASNNDAWIFIHETICRELGIFSLSKNSSPDPLFHCQQYLQSADVDGRLDLIELSFRYIDTMARHLTSYEQGEFGITQQPEDAIDELNQRFRENAVGYQFMGGEIIRIDSLLIHEEVVKPALSLLQSQDFAGAEEEFMKAHEHYRHGRHKEALGEALKSFESTMKSICKLKGWPYAPTLTASGLIEVVIGNGLLSKELTSQFTGVRTTLESGIPTIRNKNAGHGQGIVPLEVPNYLVAYGLHVTAAAIVLLVEAHAAG